MNSIIHLSRLLLVTTYNSASPFLMPRMTQRNKRAHFTASSRTFYRKRGPHNILLVYWHLCAFGHHCLCLFGISRPFRTCVASRVHFQSLTSTNRRTLNTSPSKGKYEGLKPTRTLRFKHRSVLDSHGVQG
jgi:hypothetical protein